VLIEGELGKSDVKIGFAILEVASSSSEVKRKVAAKLRRCWSSESRLLRTRKSDY
jgi:hypothetical protein